MNIENKEKLVEAWIASICLDDIVEDMVNAVAENLKPDEVFDASQLAEWAEENGFTKEE